MVSSATFWPIREFSPRSASGVARNFAASAVGSSALLTNSGAGTAGAVRLDPPELRGGLLVERTGELAVRIDGAADAVGLAPPDLRGDLLAVRAGDLAARIEEPDVDWRGGTTTTLLRDGFLARTMLRARQHRKEKLFSCP